MRVAIVGAGWAGMAAAVTAVQRGAHATVLEGSKVLGGRARELLCQRPDGQQVRLDNGQHILIGAYRESLSLMQTVGVPLQTALAAMPLALPFPDGDGLQTPAWAARWPAPWNALAAMVTARGWSWRERGALLAKSLAWQRAGYAAAATATVDDVCSGLPQRVMAELIEPLCVSALNLPTAQASAAVFLRVLRDSLNGPGFGDWAASSLLLPRQDLGTLFPTSAARWLASQHPTSFELRTGTRVLDLQPEAGGWRLSGESWQAGFDAVIWATGASVAAQAIGHAATSSTGSAVSTDLRRWADLTQGLDFTAISTVYAWGPGVRLPQPMLALRAEADAQAALAQFVFDRGQLHADDPAQQGVLAFVISASHGGRAELQDHVLQQAERQLGLSGLQPIQTVIEKRATFACTPGLHRPEALIAPGLWAAGDYIAGPYPATLEAAVHSGLIAARALC